MTILAIKVITKNYLNFIHEYWVYFDEDEKSCKYYNFKRPVGCVYHKYMYKYRSHF